MSEAEVGYLMTLSRLGGGVYLLAKSSHQRNACGACDPQIHPAGGFPLHSDGLDLGGDDIAGNPPAGLAMAFLERCILSFGGELLSDGAQIGAYVLLGRIRKLDKDLRYRSGIEQGASIEQASDMGTATAGDVHVLFLKNSRSSRSQALC